MTRMNAVRAAISLAAALAALAVPMSPSVRADAGERRPPPLIIDTDMGLDDARALLALLSSGGGRIAGVVVTEGSASRRNGFDNLSSFLDAARGHRIPVFEGAPLPGEAPPWRETANSLGGVPIGKSAAAPRAAGDLAALRERLAASGSGICYLALGPLGSAAEILSDPAARAAVDTVWIPARVSGAEVSGWNLSIDAPSAERVMRSARRVVLIDVSAAARIGMPALFSSFEGRAPAGSWIESSLDAPGARGAHAFLHDELAAAAIARTALIAVDDRAYRIEAAGGALSLVAARDGNVRLATFPDIGAAAGALAELWRTPERTGHHDESSIPLVELLKTFHGHLGPYVVIGYRMGRLALEAAGSEGHFGIFAVVHSFLEPPRSCLIDGVQLGAGCTLGKRNIEVRATNGPAFAVFKTDRGARVTVRLRPDAAALVPKLIEEKGVEAAGMDLLAMDREDLFEVVVEPTSTEIPPAR